MNDNTRIGLCVAGLAAVALAYIADDFRMTLKYNKLVKKHNDLVDRHNSLRTTYRELSGVLKDIVSSNDDIKITKRTSDSIDAYIIFSQNNMI